MKESLTFILALVLAQVLFASGAAQDQEVDQVAQKAALAQSRGEYQTAAKLYRQLIAVRSDEPALRVNLGLMLHLSGDYRGALKQFQIALARDQRLFPANLFAGVDLLKLRQYSEALPYLTKANEINGADPLVNASLGQLYADLGDYEKSNFFYFRACTLDARGRDAWYGLGVTYLSIQRSAIEQLSAGTAGAKYLSQLTHDLAGGPYQERRENFESALQRTHTEPDNQDALLALAEISGKLAQDAVARVVEIDPSFAQVHILLGNAYSELRDVPRAEEEFRKALAQAPNDLSAHLGLATMYVREGRPDSAEEELKSVLDQRPGDPEACYLKGKLLVNNESFTAAEPYLRKALLGTPSNRPHVHALLGKVYTSQGKTRDAIEEYNRALVADHRGAYHYQLYRLYVKSGDRQKADAMLEKVKSQIGVE